MQTYFVSFLIVLSFDIIAEAARINYKSENGLIDTLRLQDHVPRKERTERIQIIPSRHQNYYRRRKAEKERGDKKANAWFEKKREYARKTRNELTKRIKTGTYSAADLEKYQKKLDSSRRYEAKNYSIRNKSRTNKPEKFRKLYQRKKEAMERGDKEAIAWFEKRKKSRHDSECGLTQRIQSNTYSTYDLEKYQRPLLGKSETVSIRGKRNQNKVSTLEHTEGKQNRSHTSNVDSFPELKRERKFQTTKGNRTVRKAKTYSTNTDHVKSGKSDDVIPQQPSKEGKAKSTDSERKRANFRAFYQRMKARKARGDKKGKEWFEARSARFSEIETGLTHRMQTATYTQTDLKRYQKRIARQARYREKRRRSKIDLNQVPSDHISQENRKEWTVPALN